MPRNLLWNIYLSSSDKIISKMDVSFSFSFISLYHIFLNPVIFSFTYLKVCVELKFQFCSLNYMGLICLLNYAIFSLVSLNCGEIKSR